MYKEYFGFAEMPFSIAPDPRYIYMSAQHREALAHLVYGFNGDGGFVLLTGEIGAGKTTVCRCLLEQIPKNSAIAFIVNPKLTAVELLAAVCDEFGIKYPGGNTSVKVFTDLINTFLLDAHARGQKALLIIDEAQNLSTDVLEQLRLLTNLETNEFKLLQIILLGQPELRDKLSRPELQQLAQRIIARYHLGPLSKKDIAAYVVHRLSVAGVRREVFSSRTMCSIYRLSRGVPRLINVICDRALLGTYVQGKNGVDKPTLKTAAREVFGETEYKGYHKKISAWMFAVILLAISAVVFAAAYFNYNKEQTPALKENTVSTPQTPSPSLPPAEQPKPLSKLSNLGNLKRLSKEAALKSIFKQWGISYESGEKISACAQAQAHGLRCLNAVSSFEGLRRLNKPAVLKLFDGQGREFYAALTAFSNQTALLTLGTETKNISVKDIEAHWLGEYTLLWRPPQDYQRDIYPGGSSAVILWLENQLSAINGKPAQSSTNFLYDGELVKQVKKFQLASGLIPDGILGAETLIYLDKASGADIPALEDKNSGAAYGAKKY
ncbi:MAG: AAA family ATPase [Nitrospirae bacterium]|nr:AAA family ATPase [Nitrospirota bacterium]